MKVDMNLPTDLPVTGSTRFKKNGKRPILFHVVELNFGTALKTLWMRNKLSVNVFFFFIQDQLCSPYGAFSHVCPNPRADSSLHTGL